MPPNNDKPMKKSVWIGSLCLFVIVAAVGITFWLNKSETPPDKASQEPVIAQETPGKVRKSIVESSQDNVGTAEKPGEISELEGPQPVVERQKPSGDDGKEKRKIRF